MQHHTTTWRERERDRYIKSEKDTDRPTGNCCIDMSGTVATSHNHMERETETDIYIKREKDTYRPTGNCCIDIPDSCNITQSHGEREKDRVTEGPRDSKRQRAS